MLIMGLQIRWAVIVRQGVSLGCVFFRLRNIVLVNIVIETVEMGKIDK